MGMSLRGLAAMLAAACCTAAFADAVPDRLGEPIDLSSFSGLGSVLEESEQTVNANATPIMSVDGPTASACMAEAEADSVSVGMSTRCSWPMAVNY